jgi:glucokinase
MYLGLEIGGTKLQVGLGLGDGKLAGLWRGTVHLPSGPEGIRDQIKDAVPELLAKSGLDKSQIKGIGIGFGGPVDDSNQTIIKSHQVGGWDDFPLATWLQEVLDIPAALGNDADVAGLAEALFGAAKGLSPIFYITIGSGIGGALIVNGEIYRGCGRGAGEIGHLSTRVFSYAPQPLETVASGWAMEKRARSSARHSFDPESPLYRTVCGQVERITAIHVGQAANQCDELALAVVRGALTFLADAICNVILLLCPRRFVIGGGVSLMGEEVLFEPLRELVSQQVFKPFAGCYDIVRAALGEEVVVHGALALARKRFPE